MKKKVLVAMSGGVDSTVAAALLLQQGFEVSGVTMDTGFGNAGQAASQVAEDLGINHYTLDLRRDFANYVIGDFLHQYSRGKTPNPCVICNKKLKFAAFWPLLDQLDYDFMATGHYVQKIEQNDRYLLKKAVSEAKDQSYFLYALSQEALSKTLFPLGTYEKTEVRQIASDLKLKAAEKSDSQDICFIPQGDYKDFYQEHCLHQPRPGRILDINGHIIGQHQGLPYYTVGQRKGLGLALGYPCYVVALDVDNNTVIIGQEKDLYKEEAFTCDNNFLPFDRLTRPLQVQVKVRYKSPPATAIIEPKGPLTKIYFVEKQKSIAPGQSAVFYQRDLVIGGGCLC